MAARLFHTRYSLHKQVYSHRVSKAVEYMLCDVLLLADPILHLSDAILSPAAYCRLTDCVLKQIECSTQPELHEARQLIHRIRTRRLYRLVEESIVPHELSSLPDVTVNDILSCCAVSGVGLGGLLAGDVQVQNLRMSYAMKDANPVDHVRFFDKSDLSRSYAIPKSKVSHVMPERFSERILRVYIKDIEEQQPSHHKPKFEALKAATQEWLRQHNCLSPLIKRTASGALSRKTSFLYSSSSSSNRSPSKPPVNSTASSAQPLPHTHASVSIAEGAEEHAADQHHHNNGDRAAAHDQLAAGGVDSHRLQPSASSSSDSSLKRKRASSGADGDSSSGEWSPTVTSSSARRHSFAPYDSPSAGTRRSSMDPPSPQLLHSAHAHAPYHYNPTLACHLPTMSPQQQTALMGSPAPAANRSASPLPSAKNRRVAASSAASTSGNSNSNSSGNGSSGSSSGSSEGKERSGAVDGLLLSPHSPTSPFPSAAASASHVH